MRDAAGGRAFDVFQHGEIDSIGDRVALTQDPGHFARLLSELKKTDTNFAVIETDCHREFCEAVRLGDFDTADAGLAEITHRRTYSRPKPPEKAI